MANLVLPSARHDLEQGSQPRLSKQTAIGTSSNTETELRSDSGFTSASEVLDHPIVVHVDDGRGEGDDGSATSDGHGILRAPNFLVEEEQYHGTSVQSTDRVHRVFHNPKLFAMGCNCCSECCFKRPRNLKEPVEIHPGTSNLLPGVQIDEIVKIVGGKHFTVILTQSGVAYGCGANLQGQLGFPSTERRYLETPEPIFRGTQASVKVRDVVAGSDYCIFLTDHGLWSAGNPADGRLGKGFRFEKELSRTSVSSDKIRKIFAGDASTMFLHENGTLTACGSNTNGSLGIELSCQLPFCIVVPKQVKLPATCSKVKDVQLTTKYSLLLDTTGAVFVSGSFFGTTNAMRRAQQTYQQQVQEPSRPGWSSSHGATISLFTKLELPGPVKKIRASDDYAVFLIDGTMYFIGHLPALRIESRASVSPVDVSEIVGMTGSTIADFHVSRGGNTIYFLTRSGAAFRNRNLLKKLSSEFVTSLSGGDGFVFFRTGFPMEIPQPNEKSELQYPWAETDIRNMTISFSSGNESISSCDAAKAFRSSAVLETIAFQQLFGTSLGEVYLRLDGSCTGDSPFAALDKAVVHVRAREFSAKAISLLAEDVQYGLHRMEIPGRPVKYISMRAPKPSSGSSPAHAIPVLDASVAVETLIMADRFGASSLREKCADVIVSWLFRYPRKLRSADRRLMNDLCATLRIESLEQFLTYLNRQTKPHNSLLTRLVTCTVE